MGKAGGSKSKSVQGSNSPTLVPQNFNASEGPEQAGVPKSPQQLTFSSGVASETCTQPRRTPAASRSPAAPRSPAASRSPLLGPESQASIRDLIAEQLVSVQHAAELNRAIEVRLRKEATSRGDSQGLDIPCSFNCPGIWHSMEEPPPTADASARQKPVSLSSRPARMDPGRRMWSCEKAPDLPVPVPAQQLAKDGASSSTPLLTIQERRCSSPGPTDCGKEGHEASGLVPMHYSSPEYKQRLALMIQEVNASSEDQYLQSGCWQAVVRSSHFSSLTLLMILTNTVWIAIDTDHNKAELLSDAPLVFQIVDNVFCFFFFFEVSVRFLAQKHKWHAFHDYWFIFDLALVMLMAWEVWFRVLLSKFTGTGGLQLPNSGGLRVLRVLRLARIARMARLLRSIPELMTLVRGTFQAVRAVVATLFLLLIVIYIFAVLFTQLLSGQSHGMSVHFQNVPTSMQFLFLQVVCGFDEDFMQNLLQGSPGCYFLFLLYVLFGSMTLMNMLIGVLCEVASEVDKAEKGDAFASEVECQIGMIIDCLDTDGSKSISKSEFEVLMEDATMVRKLSELGVDVVAFAEFAQILFCDEAEVRFSEFFDLINEFRGSRASTVKDVVNMRKFMSMELGRLYARLEERIDSVDCFHV